MTHKSAWTKRPTKAQTAALVAIHEYANKNGRPPSLVDLRDKLGRSSTTTVCQFVMRLRRDGFLERLSGPRSIVLTREGKLLVKEALAPLSGDADVA